MLRERSTWKGTATPRQAATSRKADIYTMNQEHPQPSVTEYVNGDPDSWAETPVPAEKSSVNDEYDGDAVKRNEVGFAEFRSDTFKHKDSDRWGGPGKYDNAKVSADRKAVACERLARAVLKTDNQGLIESTALGFMSLPNRVLASTLKNLDKASVQSLPADIKHRRALACAKLSHRLLGQVATEASVEALGGLFMKVEDSTLKSMIKVVASSLRTAQEQETEEETQTAQQQEPQVKEEPKTAQEQEPKTEEACDACVEVAPPAVGEPVDEFAELFGEAVPAVAPEAAADVVVALPGSEVEVVFDDDDDVALPENAISSLSALFSENPEAMAQRQVVSARQEQAARERGIERTASTQGAKKLGQVRQASGKVRTPAEQLANIWD
jgi:hypothetical protein